MVNTIKYLDPKERLLLESQLVIKQNARMMSTSAIHLKMKHSFGIGLKIVEMKGLYQLFTMKSMKCQLINFLQLIK